MYLINKGGTLKNLCLRGVYLSKKFSKTQNKQTLIYLRAPKHFNIGKQEVLSFRNKFSYYYKPDWAASTLILIKYPHFFFRVTRNVFKFHHLKQINSVRVTIKLKIKWLTV